MEALEAIFLRRSIRDYTEEKVSEADIKTLLDAAMAAPSAGNAQPWRFVVIDDRALLGRIGEINQYAAMAARAPLAIMVCADPSSEKYPGFWVQDCSAAIENLLVAATALGLGAVWTGLYPMEGRLPLARQIFGLPGHIMPLAIIVIGHPAAKPEPKSRFDPAKVHRNRW